MGLGLLEDMLLGTMVGSQKARDDDLRLGTVGRKHTMLTESRRQALRDMMLIVILISADAGREAHN
jgi:hypothetical protein